VDKQQAEAEETNKGEVAEIRVWAKDEQD